ncbi:hypothetical protein ACQPX6_17595 [Actinomycetospora sp. CA-101289]|uniref:hypothetical protein n=1 Tax=Actinomycetospora sp. CA-101289 TaxID=3239893 RepID=UPI003D9792F7
MPLQNPARAVETEQNVARRIAYERLRRDWSYEHVAKLMTNAGCPLQGSAVFKIEKGRPPRRITVDELVTFAAIFGTTAVDLLRPVALIGDNEASALVNEWIDVQREIGDLTVRADALADRLDDLRRSGTLRDFPIHQVLGSRLFKDIRKAQAKATAAFSAFLHEWQHPDGSADPASAALISDARARSGVDDHGRSRPEGTPR